MTPRQAKIHFLRRLHAVIQADMASDGFDEFDHLISPHGDGMIREFGEQYLDSLAARIDRLGPSRALKEFQSGTLNAEER